MWQRLFPCDLELVNIYEQPEVVVSRGVLAVPTLIKSQSPLSGRVLIGDFTDEQRVLVVLGLLEGRTEA
jgi:hypothetical protein